MRRAILPLLFTASCGSECLEPCVAGLRVELAAPVRDATAGAYALAGTIGPETFALDCPGTFTGAGSFRVRCDASAFELTDFSLFADTTPPPLDVTLVYGADAAPVELTRTIESGEPTVREVCGEDCASFTATFE